jgi:hypothetical protein
VTRRYDGESNKWLHNFGWETSWDTSTWKTEKKLGGKIKMDLRETAFENWRWMHLAHDLGQWRSLVLEVLEISGSAATVLCIKITWKRKASMHFMILSSGIGDKRPFFLVCLILR